MKAMRCLGIDTSNYTTSAAVYQGTILENRRMLLPVKPGEKGLRQSDAVFHHVRQLPQVLGPVLEAYSPMDAVGVSIAPRSAEGSYMPCFLVGKGFAESLGKAWGVPVEYFSHQQRQGSWLFWTSLFLLSTFPAAPRRPCWCARTKTECRMLSLWPSPLI